VIPARSNIWLAPMAGVTDAAFRQIAIEQGAGFTYTEMVSAKGLEYGSERTASLLSPAENEDVFGVQLFASDPDAVASSIRQLCEAFPFRLCVIDLNMGCPAPKITGGLQGSALMKDLPLAERIIRAAVKTSPLPVTVKFRKGWDDASVNAVEFAHMAQDAANVIWLISKLGSELGPVYCWMDRFMAELPAAPERSAISRSMRMARSASVAIGDAWKRWLAGRRLPIERWKQYVKVSGLY